MAAGIRNQYPGASEEEVAAAFGGAPGIATAAGAVRMRIEEVTARVLDVLNELEIPYVLVGAFSANFHGIARFDP